MPRAVGVLLDLVAQVDRSLALDGLDAVQVRLPGTDQPHAPVDKIRSHVPTTVSASPAASVCWAVLTHQPEDVLAAGNRAARAAAQSHT